MGHNEDTRQQPVTMQDLEKFAKDKLTVMVLNGDGQKHPKPIGEAVEVLFDELGWLRDIGRGYRLVMKYKWQVIIALLLLVQFFTAINASFWKDINVFDFLKSLL